MQLHFDIDRMVKEGAERMAVRAKRRAAGPRDVLSQAFFRLLGSVRAASSPLGSR